jgi:cell pole-organizing protein PopZ
MAEPETEPEALGEDETVLTDNETEEMMFLEEAEPFLEEAEPMPETESASFWPPQDYALGEAQPAPAAEISAAPSEVATETVYAASAQVETETISAGTNGVAPDDTSGPKSLEDSIKEMLRPMLREWLDENMPRMIREELDSDALQRKQD